MVKNQVNTKMKKATIATAMGNVVEWYEYGVYSYTAGIIGTQFFPSGSTTTAFLYAFALFAISFFFRPLGGIIFGSIGDRLGRKKILTITIILMSLSTAAIGIIPSYESFGIAATILLVVMRMIQGLAAGGEYGAATVFTTESAPYQKRGLFTSFLESGVLFGYIIGASSVALLTFILSADAMNLWGWRIPFILSLPLALIGMYLRTKVDDTPVFSKLQKEDSLSEKPFKEMFSTARKPLLTTFCCIAFANGAYYTLLTYLPSYFETEIGLSASNSLLITIIGMIFMIFLIPFVGILSDHFGRKLFMFLSSILAIISAVPIFWLIMDGGNFGPLFGFLLLGILVSLFVGAQPAALPPLFPSRVRNSGYSFSYNISTAIFGGGAPFIITALTSLSQSSLTPSFFLVGVAIIAVIGLLFVPETAKKPIHQDGIDKST